MKQSFLEFLQNLYYEFVLQKKACSYDLLGFDKYVDVFFDKDVIIEGAKKKFEKMVESK